jgi:hypothetical protein
MRRRSLQSLLVVRYMLVTNGILLGIVAALYAAFGTRPGGYIVGGVLGAAALGLWFAVPLTDPYRAERVRHHRSW